MTLTSQKSPAKSQLKAKKKYARNNKMYSKYEADRRKKFNDLLDDLKIALEDPSNSMNTKTDILKCAILFVKNCKTLHSPGNKFSDEEISSINKESTNNSAQKKFINNLGSQNSFEINIPDIQHQVTVSDIQSTKCTTTVPSKVPSNTILQNFTFVGNPFNLGLPSIKRARNISDIEDEIPNKKIKLSNAPRNDLLLSGNSCKNDALNFSKDNENNLPKVIKFQLIENATAIVDNKVAKLGQSNIVSPSLYKFDVGSNPKILIEPQRKVVKSKPKLRVIAPKIAPKTSIDKYTGNILIKPKTITSTITTNIMGLSNNSATIFHKPMITNVADKETSLLTKISSNKASSNIRDSSTINNLVGSISNTDKLSIVNSEPVAETETKSAGELTTRNAPNDIVDEKTKSDDNNKEELPISRDSSSTIQNLNSTTGNNASAELVCNTSTCSNYSIRNLCLSSTFDSNNSSKENSSDKGEPQKEATAHEHLKMKSVDPPVSDNFTVETTKFIEENVTTKTSQSNKSENSVSSENSKANDCDNSSSKILVSSESTHLASTKSNSYNAEYLYCNTSVLQKTLNNNSSDEGCKLSEKKSKMINVTTTSVHKAPIVSNTASCIENSLSPPKEVNKSANLISKAESSIKIFNEHYVKMTHSECLSTLSNVKTSVSMDSSQSVMTKSNSSHLLVQVSPSKISKVLPTKSPRAHPYGNIFAKVSNDSNGVTECSQTLTVSSPNRSSASVLPTVSLLNSTPICSITSPSDVTHRKFNSVRNNTSVSETVSVTAKVSSLDSKPTISSITSKVPQSSSSNFISILPIQTLPVFSSSSNSSCSNHTSMQLSTPHVVSPSSQNVNSSYTISQIHEGSATIPSTIISNEGKQMATIKDACSDDFYIGDARQSKVIATSFPLNQKCSFATTPRFSSSSTSQQLHQNSAYESSVDKSPIISGSTNSGELTPLKNVSSNSKLKETSPKIPPQSSVYSSLMLTPTGKLPFLSNTSGSYDSGLHSSIVSAPFIPTSSSIYSLSSSKFANFGTLPLPTHSAPTSFSFSLSSGTTTNSNLSQMPKTTLNSLITSSFSNTSGSTSHFINSLGDCKVSSVPRSSDCSESSKSSTVQTNSINTPIKESTSNVQSFYAYADSHDVPLEDTKTKNPVLRPYQNTSIELQVKGVYPVIQTSLSSAGFFIPEVSQLVTASSELSKENALKVDSGSNLSLPRKINDSVSSEVSKVSPYCTVQNEVNSASNNVVFNPQLNHSMDQSAKSDHSSASKKDTVSLALISSSFPILSDSLASRTISTLNNSYVSNSSSDASVGLDVNKSVVSSVENISADTKITNVSNSVSPNKPTSSFNQSSISDKKIELANESSNVDHAVKSSDEISSCTTSVSISQSNTSYSATYCSSNDRVKTCNFTSKSATLETTATNAIRINVLETSHSSEQIPRHSSDCSNIQTSECISNITHQAKPTISQKYFQAQSKLVDSFDFGSSYANCTLNTPQHLQQDAHLIQKYPNSNNDHSAVTGNQAAGQQPYFPGQYSQPLEYPSSFYNKRNPISPRGEARQCYTTYKQTFPYQVSEEQPHMMDLPINNFMLDNDGSADRESLNEHPRYFSVSHLVSQSSPRRQTQSSRDKKVERLNPKKSSTKKSETVSRNKTTQVVDNRRQSPGRSVSSGQASWNTNKTSIYPQKPPNYTAEALLSNQSYGRGMVPSQPLNQNYPPPLMSQNVYQYPHQMKYFSQNSNVPFAYTNANNIGDSCSADYNFQLHQPSGSLSYPSNMPYMSHPYHYPPPNSGGMLHHDIMGGSHPPPPPYPRFHDFPHEQNSFTNPSFSLPFDASQEMCSNTNIQYPPAPQMVENSSSVQTQRGASSVDAPSNHLKQHIGSGSNSMNIPPTASHLPSTLSNFNLTSIIPEIDRKGGESSIDQDHADLSSRTTNSLTRAEESLKNAHQHRSAHFFPHQSGFAHSLTPQLPQPAVSGINFNVSGHHGT